MTGRQPGRGAPERNQDSRDAESVAALDAGGIPVSARDRLAATGEGRGAWTSDLSVAELAAVRRAGFEPLGLVMGSSVYRIGSQWGYAYYQQVGGGYSRAYYCPHAYAHEGMRTGWNWEHTVYEAGVGASFRLAMERMVREASDLGAHGVAGVRITWDRPGGMGGASELKAVGTALRRPGGRPLDEPFTSHLSGQGLAKLIATGWAPSALVAGICAIEVDPGCGTEWRMGSFGSVELPQFSEAVAACREIAVQRVEESAAKAGDGVLGVSVDFSVHELPAEAKLVELFVLGTAVVQFSEEPLPAPPLAIMPLSDRPGRTQPADRQGIGR